MAMAHGGHARRRHAFGTKSYAGTLADAGIMGALALFGSLAANAFHDPWLSLRSAVFSAGLAFFVQLAIERGLKRL